MRKSWPPLVLVAPLVCAAMLAACGGSDGANDDRRAQQPLTNAPEQSPGQTVALKGCVEIGSGASEYVLRNVQFASPGVSDPQRNTTSPEARSITEGSWVRLAGEDQDFAKYAGQLVTLKGVVADTGRNTIGTAGAEGVPTPSGDRSRAAADEHYSKKVAEEAGRIGRESMSNGAPPEVRVNAMEGTGQKCD